MIVIDSDAQWSMTMARLDICGCVVWHLHRCLMKILPSDASLCWITKMSTHRSPTSFVLSCSNQQPCGMQRKLPNHWSNPSVWHTPILWSQKHGLRRGLQYKRRKGLVSTLDPWHDWHDSKKYDISTCLHSIYLDYDSLADVTIEFIYPVMVWIGGFIPKLPLNLSRFGIPRT